MCTFTKLAEGTSSTAYKYVQNNKPYVMCQSTTNKNPSQWARRARRYATITQAISRKQNIDYAIATLTNDNNIWNIHMNFISGEQLSPERFKTLSFETQEKILTDLAIFYLTLHELNINYKDETFATKITGKQNKFCLYAHMIKHFIVKYKKTFFSMTRFLEKRSIKKHIKQIENKYKNSTLTRSEFKKMMRQLNLISIHPNSFQYYGPYHGDIYRKNIFFDDATQKTGIIDFGGSTYRKNIYMDLGYTATPHRMGWDFISRLSEKINQLSMDISYQWKRHIHIDLNLLKSFMIYTAIKESRISDEKIKQLLKII